MQDVLRSQALLLLVICMWQELKPELIHPEFILFFSHAEGLLDVNFLQYLEPDEHRESDLLSPWMIVYCNWISRCQKYSPKLQRNPSKLCLRGPLGYASVKSPAVC